MTIFFCFFFHSWFVRDKVLSFGIVDILKIILSDADYKIQHFFEIYLFIFFILSFFFEEGGSRYDDHLHIIGKLFQLPFD